MQIAGWMNRQVVSCRAEDDLNQVARWMWDRDLGSLPVLDKSGRLIGVVTDRDVCMSAYIKGKALHEVPLSTCMQRQVQTCRPEDSLERALALMAEWQVRRLPIVDAQGMVVGTFSIADAARAASEIKEVRAKRLLAEQVCATLAAVAAPREMLRAERVVELEPQLAKKPASAATKPARSSAKKR